MLNNLLQMHSKLCQKEQFKKQQKQLVNIIENKIADKITRGSKTSPQNNSETNEEEMLREKYIFPELRQKLLMIKIKGRLI